MYNRSYENAKVIMDIARTSKDPTAMLQKMAQTNPRLREVMDIVNRTGDPKSAFYQMASAKGVDPEAILSMIRK